MLYVQLPPHTTADTLDNHQTIAITLTIQLFATVIADPELAFIQLN